MCTANTTTPQLCNQSGSFTRFLRMGTKPLMMAESFPGNFLGTGCGLRISSAICRRDGVHTFAPTPPHVQHFFSYSFNRQIPFATYLPVRVHCRRTLAGMDDIAKAPLKGMPVKASTTAVEHDSPTCCAPPCCGPPVGAGGDIKAVRPRVHHGKHAVIL